MHTINIELLNYILFLDMKHVIGQTHSHYTYTTCRHYLVGKRTASRTHLKRRFEKKWSTPFFLHTLPST